MWKSRILSAAGALAIAAVLTFAVIRLSPSAPQPAREIYKAAGVAPNAAAVTLAGNTADAEMFVYWLNNNCSYWDYILQMYTGTGLDLHGEMPNGANAADFIRKETVQTLKQQLVLENMAAEVGAVLTAEDEQAIAAQRTQAVESLGGEEAYRAELAKTGITPETYERIMRADYLYQALFNEYNTPGSSICPSEETLADYAAQQEYITADHLLLTTIDPNTHEKLSDEEVEAKRALAEDLLWQLRDSRDPVTLFAQLADEYSEDPGREAYPDGYTFTHGSMVREFEDAAYALGEYEFSDLVETSYGYHILLRKPLDVHEACDAVREEYFDTLFRERFDSAQAEVSPAIEAADIAAIYEALLAAQSEA